MAKVKVAGQAIVIISEIKLDDIKTVAKYRPAALTLYEGEGDDREPVFAIGIGEVRIRAEHELLEVGEAVAVGIGQRPFRAADGGEFNGKRLGKERAHVGLRAAVH